MTKPIRPKIPKFSTIIVSEGQKEILATKIMNLPVDVENPIQVDIGEKPKKRGLDQNAYYWKRMTEISEQAFSNGRQYNDDIWHEYCKRHVMPDQVENKSGEVVSKWSELPDGSTAVISTTELSKKQFAAYTEMCEAMGAELGVMFSANPKWEERCARLSMGIILGRSMNIADKKAKEMIYGMPGKIEKGGVNGNQNERYMEQVPAHISNNDQ